jgi:NADH:ubiquinone oxidoreductase subunit
MPGFSRVKAVSGRSRGINPQNLVDNQPALACCYTAWHADAMSILEMLHARLTARKIGQDRFGNTYFEARKTLPVYNRKRRYVVTAHGQDPTKVPAEWHAWLHHTTDAPLDETRRLPWQKEHQPNLTGTPGAWRPKGHDYSGGQRRVTGGDYEAWTP